MRARRRQCRSGQSLVESCIVIVVGCLLCFGVFQVSQLYAARSVLSYTAAAAARARTVGFNDFMVYKVTRTAAIPNAGRMITPSFQRSTSLAALIQDPRPGRIGRLMGWSLLSDPISPQYEVEQSRIPLYLGAVRWGELPAILDYENWDDVHYIEAPSSDELVLTAVRQNYELRWPLVRSFYAGDRVRLDSGRDPAYVVRERHYPMYLQE